MKSLFGQCPNRHRVIFRGASLIYAATSISDGVFCFLLVPSPFATLILSDYILAPNIDAKVLESAKSNVNVAVEVGPRVTT